MCIRLAQELHSGYLSKGNIIAGVSFLELLTTEGGSVGWAEVARVLGYSQGLGQLLFLYPRRNISIVPKTLRQPPCLTYAVYTHKDRHVIPGTGTLCSLSQPMPAPISCGPFLSTFHQSLPPGTHTFWVQIPTS